MLIFVRKVPATGLHNEKALLEQVTQGDESAFRMDAKAATLINNTANFTLITDLAKIFVRGSKEAIWQINSAR